MHACGRLLAPEAAAPILVNGGAANGTAVPEPAPSAVPLQRSTTQESCAAAMLAMSGDHPAAAPPS